MISSPSGQNTPPIAHGGEDNPLAGRWIKFMLAIAIS